MGEMRGGEGYGGSSSAAARGPSGLHPLVAQPVPVNLRAGGARTLPDRSCMLPAQGRQLTSCLLAGDSRELSLFSA